ncbi:MAG: cupin domain-containing protein [Mucilaginibacter polytrichastri]|nr:cupin domain-containing protein [Mucilaginibacter polytrichastri]
MSHAIFSTENSLKQYTWGDDCEGWNFVEEPALSVKQERMPAGTAEHMHVHQHAGQFFFILSGEAVFTIENSESVVGPRQGIRILPGQAHRIRNAGTEPLEFLLISTPSTNNDRINL